MNSDIQNHLKQHTRLGISQDNIHLLENRKQAALRDLDLSCYDLLLKKVGGT